MYSRKASKGAVPALRKGRQPAKPPAAKAKQLWRPLGKRPAVDIDARIGAAVLVPTAVLPGLSLGQVAKTLVQGGAGMEVRHWPRAMRAGATAWGRLARLSGRRFARTTCSLGFESAQVYEVCCRCSASWWGSQMAT